ncbi:SCP2 sterol-binding domain-containing protein [Ectobacillus funiculus]|uniref:SCP2 sterol-binding domain-containing protein n=1 Tax=Ectobacillus funiculus TaxID=137993 RepID=UPI00397D8C1F
MFPTLNWIKRYLELLNKDEELRLYGKKFNLLYAIESDNHKYVIQVKNGLFTINTDQEELPQLTLRTSSDHWMNFAEPTLVPTYTDLFGAAAHGKLEIQGDVQHIWSNIRSLWRSFEIMRKVGEV